MDIYCPRCGEPTDIEEFHYLAEVGSAEYGGITPENRGANVPAGSSYKVAKDAFLANGCEAFGLPQCEVDTTSVKAYIVANLADVFGDDLDGLAADLEDAEHFGLL